MNDKDREGQISIIHVDINNMELDKEIEIKDLIPLETSDHCLIGYTSKVIYNQNRVFVMDHYRSKAMYIFDEKGRFVFGTKKGKGPGEVSDPQVISLSGAGSSIYLFESTISEIKEYGFNGNLLGSHKIPRLSIEDFLPIGDDKFLVYHTRAVESPSGENTRTIFSICSNNFSSVDPLDIFIKKDQLIRAMNPAAISENKVLFISDYSYDINALCDHDYQVKYRVDFGNDGLSKEQLETLSDMELIDMVRIDNHDVVGRLNSIAFNEEFILFSAEYANDWLAFVYSLSEQKTYNLENYITAGILPKLRVMGINEMGFIYGLVKPEDMIEFQNLTGNYGDHIVKSEDNPILISFSLKI